MPSSYCTGKIHLCNSILEAPWSGQSKLLQVPSIVRNWFMVGREQLNSSVGSIHSANSKIVSVSSSSMSLDGSVFYIWVNHIRGLSEDTFKPRWNLLMNSKETELVMLKQFRLLCSYDSFARSFSVQLP